MKIALVHDYLYCLGGAERVLLSLLKIFPEAHIYTLIYDKKATKGRFEDFKIFSSFLGKSLFGKSFPLVRILGPVAIESFDLSQYDLVISSSGAYAHGVLTKTSTPHICYYHTPMRYAWDYYHTTIKNEYQSRLKRFLAVIPIHYLRIWDFAASKRPDYVIANSQTVAKRINQYYRRSVDKVINPPLDTKRLSPIAKTHKDEEKDYFLIVSRLTPYKKVDLAVETANLLKEKLIVVGEGKLFGKLKKLAGETVQIVGYKSDEEVGELMKNAKAFIFPTEDDFGIAPVEAMSAGVPVIAYKAGGATETVIEGKNGIFFEEQTPDSLTSAIQRFKKLEKEFDPKIVSDSVQKFSEENFIKNFKAFLKETIGLSV